jgi:dUTP pyrophosphatase
MNDLPIRIKNTSDLPLPEYQSEGAAGFDFRANLEQTVTIRPHERAIVPTGIHIALPAGYELQLRGRSGLAAKYGIGLVNGVGTIDSDYRGEIRAILINHGNEAFVIEHGDRIAQGVIARYERAAWEPADELEQTDRATGGFGSTGYQ